MSRDQIRSFDRSIWKAPAIWRAVEIALLPHHIIKNASWLSSVKSCSSPASVKSVWAAEAASRREPSSASRAIAAAAMRARFRPGNSQQAGSSSAAYRVTASSCRHHPEPAIIVERNIAELRPPDFAEEMQKTV